MSDKPKERETFSSRLGFLMLSAACAVGLGNVWRFPFITGKYGGGIFVAVYLLFLLAVLPVMIMEFAVGRASKRSLGLSFHVLEKPGSSWHKLGWVSLVGCYSLMMFYTTISGWMLKYGLAMAQGKTQCLDPNGIGLYFGQMLKDPVAQIVGMTITTVSCFAINALGLRRGVERVIKWMMLALFLLLVILVGRVIFLPNASAGISYFLWPDLERFTAASPIEICNAAMSQAFFTLGIGIGTMATIGSYYTKEKSLTGEAFWVAGLDTVVALLAGLIIFPACFAFNINPDSGPGLIFITLPNVFNSMNNGNIWGTIFFLFMAFAAFSTVIAVFETIISYSQDVFNLSRPKAAIINCLILWCLSLPCALGWSTFSNFVPLGPGTNILDLEDFITSCNILPLGAIIFTLFCSLRSGWGFDRFMAEANQGSGIKLPHWIKWYLRYVLPIILIALLIAGYIHTFFK